MSLKGLQSAVGIKTAGDCKYLVNRMYSIGNNYYLIRALGRIVTNFLKKKKRNSDNPLL